MGINVLFIYPNTLCSQHSNGKVTSIPHKGEVLDIGLCHLPGPRAGSPYAGDPSALTPKGNQPNLLLDPCPRDPNVRR